MNCKIYVVTHKQFKQPELESYIPIQVGKLFTKNDLGYISDDSNENIASKNKTYCELTALYWIWKNDNDSDVIGLCHYRRYFTKSMFFSSPLFFITEKYIKRILKEYDIIVPKKNNWRDKTVREYYSMCSGRDLDLLKTRDVIALIYPNYIDSFDYILNQNEAYYCNMMITSTSVIKSYCEWLFNILEELEKNIDLKDYTPQESRVFGYLSEILLNVWVHYNHLKYKQISVINTETSLPYRVKSMINNYRGLI